MRQILLMFLVYILSGSVSASISIFACEPEWAALAEEIAGKNAIINSATTAHQDPHYIQARPSLIARARSADLLFCTGADLEVGWLPLLLRKSGNTQIQPGKPGYLMASEYVRLLDIPTVVDRSGGDIHPYGSPHMHLDPRNISIIADELRARLMAIDAAHAMDYEMAYTAFVSRWEHAIHTWERRAEPLRGTSVLSQHNNWSYLNNWLGLKQINVLEPKPGLAPGASHLAQLVEQYRLQPAKLLMYAAYQDPRASNWYADKTGIAVVELPYTVGGSSSARDIFGLFDDTINRMLEAME